MLYLVTATVARGGIGGRIVKLPTFILHTALLRILGVGHAKALAIEMLKSVAVSECKCYECRNCHHGGEVSVDVYELDEIVGVEGVGKVES